MLALLILPLMPVWPGEAAQCGLGAGRQVGELGCRPRPALLPVPPPANASLLAPALQEVERCAGSCGLARHACLPSTTVEVEVAVLVAGPVQPGLQQTQCGLASLTHHLSCTCACPLSSCPPGQVSHHHPFLFQTSLSTTCT